MSAERTAGRQSRDHGDLLASLALLGLVVAIALVGLAFDGNWPKVLRVAASAAIYATTLLSLARRRTPTDQAGAVPFGYFASAGACAGVVSGLVRPVFRPDVLLVGSVAAATLLGGVHWLSLRYWRRLRPPERAAVVPRDVTDDDG